jgi:hypothetical protein
MAKIEIKYKDFRKNLGKEIDEIIDTPLLRIEIARDSGIEIIQEIPDRIEP